MNIRVHDAEKLSLEQIRLLVSASEGLRFKCENREQRYGWVEAVLIEHQFATLGKGSRGLLHRYLETMTGLSRAQVTRLISAYRTCGQVRVAEYVRRRFPPRYTPADVELLARVALAVYIRADQGFIADAQLGIRDVLSRVIYLLRSHVLVAEIFEQSGNCQRFAGRRGGYMMH